ncbi:MAG: response regulator [Cyanobacteriota bacterium]|nr:response regulator [Cyanobacteriota bacterium]
MKILLVEDDEPLAELLIDSLKQQRHILELARDGLLGLDLAQSMEPDLIIIDVNLPKLDGISLCKKLRSQGSHTPILLLTAHASDSDKIVGLDAGADDYLVKPVSLGELAARVRALSRRGQVPPSLVLSWGELRLDPTTCQVSYGGKPITLRPKEYSLLELLLRNGRRVFSRGAILDQLWTLEDSPNEDTIKAHIKGLRQNLKAGGAPPDLIESVYGLGYRLNPALEQVAPVAPPSDPNPAIVALTAAWPRFKPKMLERLEIIEQALHRLAIADLPEAERQQAQQAAHKLAGSLGTLGFTQGSALARRLEVGIQSPPRPLAELQSLCQQLQAELAQEPRHNSPLPSTPATIGSPLWIRLLTWGLSTDLEQSLRLAAPVQAIHLTPLLKQEDDLPAWIQTLQPDVLLVDLRAWQGDPSPLQQLQSLWDPFPLPIIVIPTQDTLAERRQIAKWGGHGVVAATTPSHDMLAAVRDLYRSRDSAPAKLLLVDDDASFLEMLVELLQPWGFEILTLNQPLLFWETLQQTQPDLLILDVEMPEVSGIELCQVVRQSTTFEALPILFLTAHRDPASIIHVFNVGGDDYVNKPVVGPELIARILNRLERRQKKRYR